MKISKDAAVKAVGTPEGEDLALINALARRELGADEVYTFSLRLCDNDIDRDFERFDDGALDALAPMFVGVSGVFDHQWSAHGQTARIYRTAVEDEPGTLTQDGRPYRCLMGWAYLMRTGENEALIAELDGGIKREVSVGCAVEEVLCSICGRPLEDCPHEKGEDYGGETCVGVLTHPTDAYEWSFVAVPAQRRAGVVKSAGSVRDEARLGQKYLKGLRRELVRAAGTAEPELGHALLEKVAARLDEEELLGLIRVYRAKAARLMGGAPQLCYGTREGEPDQADRAFLI